MFLREIFPTRFVLLSGHFFQYLGERLVGLIKGVLKVIQDLCLSDLNKYICVIFTESLISKQ
jgi:hypothetical protein